MQQRLFQSRCRALHSSSRQTSQSLKQKAPSKPQYKAIPRNELKRDKNVDEKSSLSHVKRNAVGVQLLSRPLHAQVFKNISFPPPTSQATNISLSHLRSHNLSPSQASVLPSTSFDLPPLHGQNILEHFHTIGSSSSEPYLSLAKAYASLDPSTLPPIPQSEDWVLQSGWTKYHFLPDGSSYHESVPYPMDIETGEAEQVLAFDVETMPNYHPYPIIACALSPTAWYTWISPWLLEETDDPVHLVPLGPKGDAAKEKVVIGHNVSYDRARIGDEYTLAGTKTRFLDTMALHIAVKGISSHQRPAWMKYRKGKERELKQKEEAATVMEDLLAQVRDKLANEEDETKRRELMTLEGMMEDSLRMEQERISSSSEGTSSGLLGVEPEDTDGDSTTSKRWEEITSANSLLDIHSLYFPDSPPLNKTTRDDFMTQTPQTVLASLPTYLSYCASDVRATQAVFTRALPAFLDACPHPVSFAGILTMGSGVLCVDQSWEEYIKRAEDVYWGMERSLRDNLKELAEKTKGLMGVPPVEDAIQEEGEVQLEKGLWEDDPWLEQLDWTFKVARKSRGVGVVLDDPVSLPSPEEDLESDAPQEDLVPAWYHAFTAEPFSKRSLERIVPALLQMTWDSHPLVFTPAESWHYVLPNTDPPEISRPPSSSSATSTKKITTILRKLLIRRWVDSPLFSCIDPDLAMRIAEGDRGDDTTHRIRELADSILNGSSSHASLTHLDWTPISASASTTITSSRKPPKPKPPKAPKVHYPKWYWDLTRPKVGTPPGTLEITIRSRIAPILLRLSWFGYPLVHSREHGWCFRVGPERAVGDVVDVEGAKEEREGKKKPVAKGKKRLELDLSLLKPLTFYDPADTRLSDQILKKGYRFFKLPHQGGESKNVGNPFGKTFVKWAEDGVLRSELDHGQGNGAEMALEMNAMCSYWISARDRIMNQMVVWEDKEKGRDLGFPESSASASMLEEGKERRWGIILPQVITMGTVTRRAIEKTWLTASNAKKTRVGSELKAMVRAPPGYAIVGADVDSEELWISSAMGDSQFGMHGATAIGWMTLEGTKAQGTDLHSKTAGILGISREQAKVFNYSRIYGAGMKHAMLLLAQSNPSMKQDEAKRLAENLYSSTKGRNTHRTDIFGRKFWFGGTESFLFNKLEEIATLAERPRTPALDCSITHALAKEHLPSEFGADYMTSRINWVVQSSGVDYLHLLIVSMDHLIRTYGIKARYLISVHDELRYIVAEEDRYRCALALQVANLWTRACFAVRLGMDDLPQGVAFFSAVDVDKVLRKEVDMPCVTPSQPNPIPPGESLDIDKILKLTGGKLVRKGVDVGDSPRRGGGFVMPDCLSHRASSPAFLRAQATMDFGEVKMLAGQATGKSYEGDIGGYPRSRRRGGAAGGKNSGKGTKGKLVVPLGDGEGYDWAELAERLLREEDSQPR